MAGLAGSADLLARYLRGNGHAVRTAYDGVEAVRAAEAFLPHLALLDIGLPKLHGYEVARQLRQRSWGHNTIVIAITGWGLETDRHGAAAGIDHRLLKPVDLTALRRLLTSSAAPS